VDRLLRAVIKRWPDKCIFRTVVVDSNSKNILSSFVVICSSLSPSSRAHFTNIVLHEDATFAEQLRSLRAYRIPFPDIASIENAFHGRSTSRTLQRMGDESFREQFFQNAISNGSDDDGNSAAGEHAVAAAPVVPANAVAAAPVNQVAVAPDGEANVAMGDGVNDAIGRPKRRRGD
jgi:hypothetical protein